MNEPRIIHSANPMHFRISVNVTKEVEPQWKFALICSTYILINTLL